MNVVYFGFNALSSCLDLLIHNAQCQVIKVYTGEDSEHSDQIVQLAVQNGIATVFKKPTKVEMQKLFEQGADCFICAEYPHKIPVPSGLAYSVNIHPTLLPEGRGQTPLPHLILKYPQYAGLTLHKITNQLDQGDILLSHPLLLDDSESFDSLQTKLFLQAPILLHQLLSDWDHLNEAASTQGKGSCWPTIKVEEQSINWSMSNKEITLRSRAFGSLGVKFNLNDNEYYYTAVELSAFTHAYAAGDVISFDAHKLTIATIDGFMTIPRSCLHEL